MIIAEDTARRNSGIRIPVDVDGVHEELKSFDHWVVWKAVPGLRQNGKLDKVPYNARNGEPASTTDSRTWSTFEEAVSTYRRSRDGWDGIGFVFSSGDPFTGIDLDNVRDPDTGALSEWVWTAVESFDGYAEISPSGEGIHLYVKGRVISRRTSSIEVYSVERFFTITGVQP